MSEKHRNYECLYIVKPDLNDQEVGALAERFKNVVVDNGGAVESAGKWEKRKLAYPIGGFKEGNYIMMLFTAGPAVPAELDRLMRISDDVLRQLIILVEKPKPEVEPKPKVKKEAVVAAAEPTAAVAAPAAEAPVAEAPITEAPVAEAPVAAPAPVEPVATSEVSA